MDDPDFFSEGKAIVKRIVNGSCDYVISKSQSKNNGSRWVAGGTVEVYCACRAAGRCV